MKNILITGAANGIGKSTFEALTKSNYDKIILLDIIEPDYLNSSSGPQTLFFRCDVANSEQVKDVFNQLEKLNIKITHCLNAAGIPGPNKPFNQSKLEEMEKVFNINFKGPVMIMQQVLNHMEEVGSGIIINMASVLANCGMSGSSSYAASKGALISFSRTLAIEYAEKNIQINTISPGAVDTSFLNRLKKRVGLENIESIHPVKRISSPSEIAKTIVFLFEECTSFMTGIDLPIDGGYSAQ